MTEGQPRELSRQEMAELGEKLAYRTAISQVRSSRLEGQGNLDHMRQLGAALFADGARKALLVANGLMTEEVLMKEIDELAGSQEELQLTEPLSDGEQNRIATEDFKKRLEERKRLREGLN